MARKKALPETPEHLLLLRELEHVWDAPFTHIAQDLIVTLIEAAARRIVPDAFEPADWKARSEITGAIIYFPEDWLEKLERRYKNKGWGTRRKARIANHALKLTKGIQILDRPDELEAEEHSERGNNGNAENAPLTGS